MADVSNTDSVEVWKPVPGWDGYEASNKGCVRSAGWTTHQNGSFNIMRYTPHRGRVLAQHACKRTGYLKVCVTDRISRKSVTTSVHKLVCLAFHGNKPADKQCVAHGNGKRHDNRPENLRWATNAENARDRIFHGTSVSRGKDCSAREMGLRYRAMLARYQAGELGKDLAAELGVHKDTIYRAFRRITKE